MPQSGPLKLLGRSKPVLTVLALLFTASIFYPRTVLPLSPIQYGLLWGSLSATIFLLIILINQVGLYRKYSYWGYLLPLLLLAASTEEFTHITGGRILAMTMSLMLVTINYRIVQQGRLLFYIGFITSCISLAAPPLLFLFIPWIFGVSYQRNLTLKSALGLLVGALFPYIYISFYYWATNSWFDPTPYLAALAHLHPLWEGPINGSLIIRWSVATLWSIVAFINYNRYSYKDNQRVRNAMGTLFGTTLFLLIATLLAFTTANTLMWLYFITAGLLGGHYFSVSRAQVLPFILGISLLLLTISLFI